MPLIPCNPGEVCPSVKIRELLGMQKIRRGHPLPVKLRGVLPGGDDGRSCPAIEMIFNAREILKNHL